MLKKIAMNKSLAALFPLILILVLGVQPSARAGHGEGVEAYKRGDYSTALRELNRAAEQGDGDAQQFLGSMYLYGRGVGQDDAEAVKWYMKAVEHDNAKAEFRLGRMYYAGRGVPQDTVLAHMWFVLAASHNHLRGIKWRDFTAKHMTSVQIEKARQLAGAWAKKFEAPNTR